MDSSIYFFLKLFFLFITKTEFFLIYFELVERKLNEAFFFFDIINFFTIY